MTAKGKVILQLCADVGSDSKIYADNGFEVIKVGKDIGVENYHYTGDKKVFGVIANPMCTEFSIVKGYDKRGNTEKGMFYVNHCLRIIEEVEPDWWYIENPATGRLKDFLGKPTFVFQPWEFGSPWTKKTAIWGKGFNIPKKLYTRWEDVPKNDNLYIRPNRSKPCLAIMHKSAIYDIPEFATFIDLVHDDMSFRSLCSQGFARAFYEVNNDSAGK